MDPSRESFLPKVAFYEGFRVREFLRIFFHGSMSFVQKLLKPARGRTLYLGLNYGWEGRVSAPKSVTMII
jgi:hypothetical protein